MKIRITEPGWANFTGQFGAIEFKDGVADDVSTADARHVASLVQIATINDDGSDGKSPSVAQVILDTHGDAMQHASLPMVDTLPAPVVQVTNYTEEQLAEIADKDGIKGIRAIADPYGLKGKNIAELIGKVLAAQAEAKAKADAAAPQEPAPPAGDATDAAASTDETPAAE